jgi:hypothetical protein
MTPTEVRIIPVTTEDQRRALARFPWKLYAADPNWVPPIYTDRLTLLNPEKHPFHQHADVQYFLAFRGEELVGTISAHVNHRHNEVWQDKRRLFRFL